MQTLRPFLFLSILSLALLFSMGCGDVRDQYDGPDFMEFNGHVVPDVDDPTEYPLGSSPDFAVPTVQVEAEFIHQAELDDDRSDAEKNPFMDGLFNVPVALAGVVEGTVIAAEVAGRLKLAFFDSEQTFSRRVEYNLVEDAEWSLMGDGRSAALVQVSGEEQRRIVARFIDSDGVFESQEYSVQLAPDVYFGLAYESGRIILNTVTGHHFQRIDLSESGQGLFPDKAELPISQLDDPIEAMITNGRSTVIRHASGTQINIEVGRCSINATQMDDDSYAVDERFSWHSGTQRFWTYDPTDEAEYRFIDYAPHSGFSEVSIPWPASPYNRPVVVAGASSLKLASIDQGAVMITDVPDGEIARHRLEEYAHRGDAAVMAPGGDAILVLTTGRPHVNLVRIPLAE